MANQHLYENIHTGAEDCRPGTVRERERERGRRSGLRDRWSVLVRVQVFCVLIASALRLKRKNKPEKVERRYCDTILILAYPIIDHIGNPYSGSRSLAFSASRSAVAWHGVHCRITSCTTREIHKSGVSNRLCGIGKGGYVEGCLFISAENLCGAPVHHMVN